MPLQSATFEESEDYTANLDSSRTQGSFVYLNQAHNLFMSSFAQECQSDEISTVAINLRRFPTEASLGEHINEAVLNEAVLIELFRILNIETGRPQVTGTQLNSQFHNLWLSAASLSPENEVQNQAHISQSVDALHPLLAWAIASMRLIWSSLRHPLKPVWIDYRTGDVWLKSD